MRRAKRCIHGFLYAQNCRECAALGSAVYRAKRRDAAKARGSLLQSVTICAVCDRIGHVSKLCPTTAVGRERAARICSTALDLVDSRGEGSSMGAMFTESNLATASDDATRQSAEQGAA